MTSRFSRKQQFAILVIMVIGISLLHYLTDLRHDRYHFFYSDLYFLPIILASYWFAFRGALMTSLAVSSYYLPFIFCHWQGGSPNDLNRLLSVVLYNSVAAFLGTLKGREVAASQRLVQTERLAAIGKSLAAVAHDIKTPLVAIGGCARQILKKQPLDDSTQAKLNLIIKETEKIEHMMHNMLDFARPLELQLAPTALNQVVANSLKLVAEAKKKKEIVIETTLSPELPPVTVDALRLEQVLVNLILNAIQASLPGERVLVKTLAKGAEQIVEVIDFGCGIAADQRGRIFELFFTTKRGGSGLGLGIVKKIIDAHQARIEVGANPGKGTIFRIILPGH